MSLQFFWTNLSNAQKLGIAVGAGLALYAIGRFFGEDESKKSSSHQHSHGHGHGQPSTANELEKLSEKQEEQLMSLMTEAQRASKQQRYEQAEDLMLQALDILDQVGAKFLYANIGMQLLGVLQELGRGVEMVELGQRCMQAIEGLPEEPEVLNTRAGLLQHISQNYIQAEQWHEAIDSLHSYLAVVDKLVDKNDPSRPTIKMDLANAHLELHEWLQAADIYKEVLVELGRVKMPPGGFNFIPGCQRICYHKIATAYTALGDQDSLRGVLRQYDEFLGSGNIESARAYLHTMTPMLIELGDYTEAEKYASLGIEYFENLDGITPKDAVGLYERGKLMHATILHATGKHDLAAAHRSEVKEIISKREVGQDNDMDLESVSRYMRTIESRFYISKIGKAEYVLRIALHQGKARLPAGTRLLFALETHEGTIIEEKIVEEDTKDIKVEKTFDGVSLNVLAPNSVFDYTVKVLDPVSKEVVGEHHQLGFFKPPLDIAKILALLMAMNGGGDGDGGEGSASGGNFGGNFGGRGATIEEQ